MPNVHDRLRFLKSQPKICLSGKILSLVFFICQNMNMFQRMKSFFYVQNSYLLFFQSQLTFDIIQESTFEASNQSESEEVNWHD